MVKRVRLSVAYDGTNYCGFQIQQNGPTIEEELNRHLSELLEEDIKVIGASRTDSGVHALCNIVVFDTSSRIPAEKISYAMNQRLPEDIRIRKSEEVELSFHPRKSKSMKTYEYRILNKEFPIPTRRLYTHFSYEHFKIHLMKEAAAYLVGEHDFKSFCSSGSEIDSTIRTIYMLDVNENDGEISIQVSGNGFLYHMVRIIAGTLMEVGKGNITPDEMGKILERKDRSAAGPTAPAKGLTLLSYEFFD